MINGNYNPIVRTTKCIRKYKSYLESRGVDESANVAGGSSATYCGPISGGKKIKLRKNKVVIKPISERAYTLLHDPNLVIIESNGQERQLLEKAGLKIDPDDAVHIVKDRTGNIKSAIAVKVDDYGENVTEVRYIDADPKSKNFKGGISRLATLSNNLSFESNNIEVHRDEIKEGLIIND